MPDFVKVVLACDVAFTLVYFLNFGIGQPSSFITKLINLNEEANLPAWYSSYKLGIIAAMWGLIAAARYRQEPRSSMLPLVLFGAFVAMSADETASVHEWIGLKSDALLPGGERGNTIFGYTGIWFLLFAPFALAFVTWLARRVRRERWLDSQGIRLLMAGFVFYVASVLVLEALSNLVHRSARELQVLQIAAEELGEMAAATILLWAAIHVLRASGFTIPGKGSSRAASA